MFFTIILYSKVEQRIFKKFQVYFQNPNIRININ